MLDATAASRPPKAENQQIKRCNGELMEEPQGEVAVNATHINR
jgi:hypothetical protein